MRLGDTVPDFTAETTAGTIHFHEWIGDSWAILFSHPKDFTPVCTTELGLVALLEPEFARRGCKVIGLSVDSVADHQRWKADIVETQGTAVTYPMIADENLAVAKAFGMLPAEAKPGVRTPADNQTVRTVMVIGPDKKIKAMLIYPMVAGRNFHEVLRLLDALQLHVRESVSTPANWQPGDEVIIPTSMSDEDAKAKYPQGFTTLKPYLRLVSLKQ